jgi:hypothetical protein
MMQYEREALSNMNEEGGSVEASEYVESAKAPSKALRSLHRRRKYAEGSWAAGGKMHRAAP